MELDEILPREERPEYPDVHYLFKMLINVRIRKQWIDKGHPLDGFAIGIEGELKHNLIDYQEFHIPENHNLTI